jgi:hypothetical protein
MINKYEAICRICRKSVLAYQGQTNKINGAWVTEHNNNEACQAAKARVERPRAQPRYEYRDPYDRDDYDLYGSGTSEDVNPNEGDK